MPELYLHDELTRISCELRRETCPIKIQKLSDEYAELWMVLGEWRYEL